ncbi:MAG: glycosyltransferase family 4 protein [Pseudomonadota bacterium]
MIRAAFAIPGDLATRTGGYAYARALIAAAPSAGLTLDHLALPDGFPHPTAEVIQRTGARLAERPGPILIDGLALGALPAALLNGLDGPLVALCHHPLAFESGLPGDVVEALRRSEADALASCAQILVPSEATARDVAAMGVPAERVTVAVPGLEPALPASRIGDPPTILSVGALTPRKGHDLLIDALARLADRPWHCVIAGPVDRDPIWAEMLGRRAAKTGLSARISFAGAQDRAGLEALYRTADIFCLPSRHEGYGMVFAEAMMRGLPILATRVGALPELVPAGTADAAGLLVPADDVAALADGLLALLDNPVATTAMAAAGRRHALGLPRWAHTARIVSRTMAKAIREMAG